tara:strand:- start:12908 stop:13264 length:357 start_codon:yes stop_codon:yes gene_type:complete
MSFKNLLNNNVTTAFNLIGDLAENITFTNTTVSEYDFANQSTTSTTDASLSIKGVVIKVYKTNNDKPRINADIMIKSSDVNSEVLDGYDTIVLRSKTWAIKEIDDNGYVINLTIGREI